jgi:hypothetical protein
MTVPVPGRGRAAMFARVGILPMLYPVAELSEDELAVAACCRVLGVLASAFYEWRNRGASGGRWPMRR